jgi:hypothetical protein
MHLKYNVIYYETIFSRDNVCLFFQDKSTDFWEMMQCSLVDIFYRTTNVISVIFIRTAAKTWNLIPFLYTDNI